MTVDMDPAATFAVVVGIERYDAGWSLDGAANDALLAARWLRESGVPADRVRLAIDPLPDNRDRVGQKADELGLTVLEAGRDDLIDLFTKDLTGAEGRHLVVFWSGHGVLDEQHTRALFTADAHAGDQRTLRVDDLLVFLRDNEVRGFHDQIVIVDACANFAAEMKSRTSLTHATFPVSRARPGVRQFVLYAASQGELAGHNQAGKYGEFARAVLDVLRPAAGPQWPADMPALSATVAEHFGQLRQDGRSQAHPVFFSTTDWAGNEIRSSYGGIPIPGTSRVAADEAGLTASQLRRLVGAFAESPFSLATEEVVEAIRRSETESLFARLAAIAASDEERLAVVQLRRKWELQQRIAEPLRRFQGVPLPALRAYYEVVPDRQLAPRLTELDEVLEHLAEFGTADESAPLLRFVARLELFADVRLDDDWFKLTDARLRKLRAAEKRAVTATGGCHLVLHLPDDQWPAEVNGYLLTTDGQWAKRTLTCPEGKEGARTAVNHQLSREGNMTDDLARRVGYSQNFRFLAEPALLLAGDAVAAEAYANSDPDASLAKARRFSETLVKMLMRRAGLDPHGVHPHAARINALAAADVIPERIRDLLHDVRQSGNRAVHEPSGDPVEALRIVEACFELGEWWYRTENGHDVEHMFTAPAPAHAASLRAGLADVEAQLARLVAAFDPEDGSGTAIAPTTARYKADSAGLMDFYVRWFAGRHVELARIRAFLADPTPGYLLVEAPSGFGKSALATQVVYGIRSGSWDEPVPDLVYFFVREQRREHTAAAFLAAVNSQLMEITRDWRPLPVDLETLRVQFGMLWQAFLTRERPLLLVVDGLDEAAAGPELSITEMLPDQLGPYVHVLVTSRPNPVAPDAVPLEHPLRAARRMTLGPLTSADIGELLSGAGTELDGLADRIFGLTAGEPFFVRYACESVTFSGAAVLDDLANANGAVDAFFRHQFIQLSNAVSDVLTWRVLAVLTIAHGPLTVAELADALDEPRAAVDRALRPALRYLAGHSGFELPHARLRAAVEDYLGTAALAAARAAVRAWGARYARQNWPNHTPAYLVDRYLTHLDEYHDHPARVALVCPDWLRLTARCTGSYRLFADQVQTIAHSALDRDPLDVIGVVRCGLVLASLRSASGRLPASAFAAMARLGRVQEAVDHAMLQDGAVNHAAAFCAIARSAPPGSAVMHDALEHAEDATAHTLDLNYERTHAVADLVAALVAAGKRTRAVELATHLADEADRATELSRDKAAAGALAAVGAYDRAADVAARIANAKPLDLDDVHYAVYEAVRNAADAACAWARARKPDQARALAQSARYDAHRIPVEDQATIGKLRIVHGVEGIQQTVAQAYALLGEFSESVSVIKEIAIAWLRGEALIAVAEIAAEASEFALAAQLADQALGELEPGHNHEVIDQAREKELIPLLARVAAILAETGHDVAATDLLADLERRTRSRRSSWGMDHFIAHAATALAETTDAATDTVALLDHLTDPELRRDTSALCAAALADAGHHAESSALAHRVLAETQSDSPSKLNQRLRWPGSLLRAFKALGDEQAADQLTNQLLAALQPEPIITPGAGYTLLELAERRAQTGHGGTAKKALKLALHAVRGGPAANRVDQVDRYAFWVQAAVVEQTLGHPRSACRYADRGVTTFREGTSFAIQEMIDGAQRLADVGLADHGREILLAAYNRFGCGAITLRELGGNSDVFTTAFGEGWIRDQLVTQEPETIWDYRDQLGLALAWFHLGERARATQQIEKLIRLKPRAGQMQEWTESVCESAHLLLRMGIQDAAHEAFAAAVSRHLLGRVDDSRRSGPLALLRASLKYLLELPGGTKLLCDVTRTVVDTEKWLRHAV